LPRNRFGAPVYYVIPVAVNAASSCIPGTTCESSSTVILTSEYPRRPAISAAMDAGGWHVGCVGMAQVVEADARQRLML
jgi:hypothetical protein